MKQIFTASVTHEGAGYVAQCLEVDVASQGESSTEALANLREALTLHFTPPTTTLRPEIHPVELEVGHTEAAPLSHCQAEKSKLPAL